MELDNDLITRFAKITQFNKDRKDATTVRGVVRTSGEGDNTRTYIQLDGAEDGSKTPAETTVEVSDGDRVIAAVKDHSVIITGNKSNPSVGTKTAGALRSEISQTADKIKMEVSNEVSGLKSSYEQTAESIKTSVSNEIKGLKSSYEQTAESIKTSVSNEVKGLKSSYEQTAEGITSKIESVEKGYSVVKQTIDGLEIETEDGKTIISGSCIDTGSLNLTGAITWSDLSEDAKDEIDGIVDDAISDIEGVTLPDYITETYIDGARIESPKIIGGEIYAVGSDPTKNSTFSAMTEDGFFLYHNATLSDSDGDVHPKISLTVGNSGSIFSNGGDKVSIIVGAGEADSSVFRQRLFIEKDPNGAYIHFYNTDSDYCGLSMWYDGEVQAFGKWNFSPADSVDGIPGVDPLDAWPVNSIMWRYDHKNPASYLGGSWTRISPYFLYAAGSNATIGDAGYVSTSGTNAQYIKVSAWRRVS